MDPPGAVDAAATGVDLPDGRTRTRQGPTTPAAATAFPRPSHGSPRIAFLAGVTLSAARAMVRGDSAIARGILCGGHRTRRDTGTPSVCSRMRTWAANSGGPHPSKSFTVSRPESRGTWQQRQHPPEVSTRDASSHVAHDFARVEVHAPTGVIQRKPTISEPGGESERDADRVADQVMRKADGNQPGGCSCGGTCGDCQKTHSGPSHGRMQLTPAAAHTASAIDAPAVAIDAVQTSGQPLDAPTRDFMETRFGVDFSRVRIHAGDVAARAAHEVRARAYAMGHHVVFGGGRVRARDSRRPPVDRTNWRTSFNRPRPAARPRQRSERQGPEGCSAHRARVSGRGRRPEQGCGMMTEAMVLAPGATILSVVARRARRAVQDDQGPGQEPLFRGPHDGDGDLLFDAPGTDELRAGREDRLSVKGTLRVENINFQGCNIAQSPAEMRRSPAA